MSRYLFVPQWLEEQAGVREREIMNHPSVRTSNQDPDEDMNRETAPRLQRGWQRIVSDIGEFTIDGPRRMIVS